MNKVKDLLRLWIYFMGDFLECRNINIFSKLKIFYDICMLKLIVFYN